MLFCKSSRSGRCGTSLRYSIYLLYWYKSSNTDAAAATQSQVTRVKIASTNVLTLVLDAMLTHSKWPGVQVQGGRERDRERVRESERETLKQALNPEIERSEH
jgi:hypothetical protein